MLLESTLETPQGNLNLAVGPANGPVLILLHGFTNRWQTFLPIIPTLENNWQVIAFDYRGHGRSARITGAYTASSFYIDAEAVLQYVTREISPNVPVALLGHSMGGSLSMHLAQNYPEKVRSVVSGDASVNLSIHVEIMNSRRNTKLFGLRRKMAGSSLDELVRRGLRLEQAREMSQLDPRVMDLHAEGKVQAFFEDIQDVDFNKIRCPLFLVQANPLKGGLLQDSEIGPLLANYPQFRFKNFDCGHDLQIDQGADSPFIQAALTFLDHLEIG